MKFYTLIGFSNKYNFPEKNSMTLCGSGRVLSFVSHLIYEIN